MKSLTEKELNKISRLLDMGVDELKRLCKLGVVNVPSARNLIIKNDYQVNLSTGKYTKTSIIQALMIEYSSSRAKIESVIYEKGTNKREECKICGSEMSRYKYHKSDGICDDCVAKSIKL